MEAIEIVSLLDEMRACVGDDDPEDMHRRADEILCNVLRSLGYGELVDIYDEVHKWYA